MHEEAGRDCLKVITKASVKVNRAEKACSEEKYLAIILIIAIYPYCSVTYVAIARWSSLTIACRLLLATHHVASMYVCIS